MGGDCGIVRNLSATHMGERSNLGSCGRGLRMARVFRVAGLGILTIPQDTLAVQRLIRMDLVLVMGIPWWR